jgi:hypothetical protein
VWADVSPYRAVLYEVEDSNPYNRRIASVDFNHENKTFMTRTFASPGSTTVTELVIDIPTKVAAMEQALAELVIQRMNKADKH